MSYRIEFSIRARENLLQFRKRDQQIVVDAIEVQLVHQPTEPTRHRKLLEENLLAPWELRVGEFRVFYDADEASEKVIVAAVGRKSHGVLPIGGEEFEL